MSDVNRLSTLLETVKARLAQEKRAGDWQSAAASEMELQHVAGELAQAQAAEAQRLAELAAKKRTDDAARAWETALQDADDLRASWSSWVAEMEQIDSRLTAMAELRKGLELRALELYKTGDKLRSQPIAVSFPLPERLRECAQHKIPMIRG